MTESEAIEAIQFDLEIGGEIHSQVLCDAVNVAIQALEKQIPKKPVHDGCFDSEGMWHEWNGINGRPYDLCPNCNTNLCYCDGLNKAIEIVKAVSMNNNSKNTRKDG